MHTTCEYKHAFLVEAIAAFVLVRTLLVVVVLVQDGEKVVGIEARLAFQRDRIAVAYRDEINAASVERVANHLAVVVDTLRVAKKKCF